MTEGISVSELNRIISGCLTREPGLQNVTVTAEVSGFKHYISSGHWYFSLKDAEAAIPCVMFRFNAARAAFVPKDGDRVTVSGHVDMYLQNGKVQFYVETLKAAGQGSLFEQFEALKRRLEAEGLFNPGRKRVLPMVPRKVAVITSASGAAVHDILNVSRKRNPTIPIVIIHTSVQGNDAAAEIAAAIGKVGLIPDVDVAIVARGGGSAEDLWCFNEEIVARAVAACPVPVVSGVGHEVDTTICDFAADVRASTPSNAAEIVFPDRSELRGRVHLLRNQLSRAETEQVNARMLRVHENREKLQRLSPEKRIHDLADRTHRQRQELEQAIHLALRTKEETIRQQRTDLIYRTDRLVRDREFELSRVRTRLTAISPLKVLDRGYALVYDPEGRVLPDAKTASSQPRMRIRFRDGQLDVVRKDGN